MARKQAAIVTMTAEQLLDVSDEIRALATRIPDDSSEGRTAAFWMVEAAKLVERVAGARAVRELRRPAVES